VENPRVNLSFVRSDSIFSNVYVLARHNYKQLIFVLLNIAISGEEITAICSQLPVLSEAYYYFISLLVFLGSQR
jgi:hypothetical protein